MRAHKVLEQLSRGKKGQLLSPVGDMIAGTLRRAVKFYCPNVDDFPLSTDPELFRLPYPEMSFEIDTESGFAVVALTDTATALEIYPWTAQHHANVAKRGLDARAVMQLAIYHGPSDELGLVPCFIICGIAADGNIGMVVNPLRLPNGVLVEFADREQEMFLSALRVAADSLALLHCNNVPVEVVESPARLNKSRRRKGKPPIFSYSVLRLPRDHELRYRSSSDGDPTGETRRLHWVRGHIRRLTGEAATWVRPFLRGDATKGMVDKGYRVELGATEQHEANGEQ